MGNQDDSGYLRLAADLLTGALLEYAVCWRTDHRFISARDFLNGELGELCMVSLGADPDYVRHVAHQHRATFQRCCANNDADGLQAWRREYFPESTYLAEVEKRLRRGAGIQPPTTRRVMAPCKYRRTQ